MITITSSTSHVIVDMGDYYTAKRVPFAKGYWRKDQVFTVFQNTTHIEIDAVDNNSWILNHDGGEMGFQVASIDGLAPTSTADLFDKVVAIIS